MRCLMLILLFVLPVRAADKPAFDGKSLGNTSNWLKTRDDALSRASANESALEKEVAALNKDVSALAGQKIEWFARAGSIKKEGETHSRIFFALPESKQTSASLELIPSGQKRTAERRFGEYPSIVVPNSDFVAGLRGASPFLLCSTIKTARAVLKNKKLSHEFHYEFHLGECSIKEVPGGK